MSLRLNTSDLIYNWGTLKHIKKTVKIHDETLRDGLQAPYVHHPTREQKIELIKMMDNLGIYCANIGFPISGENQKKDAIAIAKEKVQNKLKIHLMCAGRTLIGDVIPIIEVQQKSSTPIEAGLVIGSSKIRQLVEHWDLKYMGKLVKESISFANNHNLPVMFVTEDTTRAHPSTLKYLYGIAISEGAKKICLCDTVGAATPEGVKNLIKFVKEKIVKKQKVSIEWHSHRDRGLELANSLAAIEAGADIIEGTFLGIGERAGNTPTELLLLFLKMENHYSHSLKNLPECIQFVAKTLGYEIPVNYPVFGQEAFNTASGMHAAAIYKALQMRRKRLASIVYCGVDPRLVGKMPEVKIGRMSGKANVLLKLQSLHIKPTSRMVNKILEFAKKHRHLLSDDEIKNIIYQSKLKLKKKNKRDI